LQDYLRLSEQGIKRLTKGTLYVVATPIGHLDDLSPRARQALDEADLIAAEDTRHTGRLLSHFGIKTRQMALHEHNEDAVTKSLIRELEGGKSVALVSDAGTPLVSDPGFRLLAAAHDHGIRVSPIPGASAVVSALSVAGLPMDRFCFEGFLPARKSARRDKLNSLQSESRTLVFFESVHRIASSIDDMRAVFGSSRRAFLGRELSKLHEQCVRSTLDDLNKMLNDGTIPAKGEFVIVVEGAGNIQTDAQKIDVNQLLLELSAELSGRQAAAIASKLTGKRKNDLYRLLLELRAGNNNK